jgi:hypothetical protein
MEDYPKEQIPDKASLYYRIHKTYIIDNEIIPVPSKVKLMECQPIGINTPHHNNR